MADLADFDASTVPEDDLDSSLFGEGHPSGPANFQGTRRRALAKSQEGQQSFAVAHASKSSCITRRVTDDGESPRTSLVSFVEGTAAREMSPTATSCSAERGKGKTESSTYGLANFERTPRSSLRDELGLLRGIVGRRVGREVPGGGGPRDREEAALVSVSTPRAVYANTRTSLD